MALTNDQRILSKYALTDDAGQKNGIYVITERDRFVTTIMLSSEY